MAAARSLKEQHVISRTFPGLACTRLVRRVSDYGTSAQLTDFTYQQREKMGGMQSAYYSDQCAPGKAMDEHLSDSTWATP
jgi:hypothetical protein